MQTLHVTTLAYGNRTWTATPPLALPIQQDARSFFVEIPRAGLRACAVHPDALEDALAVSLSIAWDEANQRAHWAHLPEDARDRAFRRSLLLAEAFRVEPQRRLHPGRYRPRTSCRAHCRGGAGCDHGREHA